MILKRPSFRRGGNSGLGSLRIKAASGFGGATANPVNLFETTPRSQITKGLSKGTSGTRLLTQLRALGVPGASTTGLMTLPFVGPAAIAYANRPRTLKEKEYMQEIGPLYETFGVSEDYAAYERERARRAKEGPEISFTDAIFMDPETGTYPRSFGRIEDRDKLIAAEKARKAETAGNVNMRGDPTQFSGEDELTNFEEINEFLNSKKQGGKTPEESSITLDPKEEIRKEAEFIKDLIGNENLTRGENALILAEAVGTPGSITDKIKKAADLTLPVVKARDRTDRAVTLKAYELFKEKEKEQAKRDAPTPSQREIASVADALIKQGDKRPREEIISEVTIKAAGLNKEGLSLLSKGGGEVFDLANTIRKERNKLAVAEGKEKPNQNDINKIKKKIKEKQAELRIIASVPGFDGIFKGLREQFLAEGGRTGFALGTPEEEEVKVSETIVDTPGAPTPERQVLKLSYAELRNKLPKEISNDIVELLVNSTEALQDFAYITTQDDVGNFNVKYGVNLVIPQTA
jgi:hypothetical protein